MNNPTPAPKVKTLSLLGFTIKLQNALRLTVLLAIAVPVGLLALKNPYTPEGHVGYVQRIPFFLGTGGFNGLNEGPGKYGLGWRTFTQNVDIRPVTFSEEFKILSNDDLRLSFRFHSILKINKDGVRDLIELHGGTNYYSRLVKEPLRTFVRDGIRKFTAVQVKANIDSIEADVHSKLDELLKDTPIEIVSLNVGNVQYPEVISNAVENKLARDQLLLQKNAEIEIKKKDAQIRIEEAKGIAKAQEIINETLTTNYLTHEAIQAQREMADSPNNTMIYIPVGPNGIPITKLSQ